MNPLRFSMILLLALVSLNRGVATTRVLPCPEDCTHRFPLEALMCQILGTPRDAQAFCDTVISGARHAVLNGINICQWTDRHVAASGGSRCMGYGGLPP